MYLHEELLYLCSSNFVTLELNWLRSPCLFELWYIIFEAIKHIIIGKIVQVELLKNDENEEIDHDVLLDYHKDDIENKSPNSSTVNSWDTVGLCVHAVEHDGGPVLSRRQPQHHDKRVRESSEVHVVVYHRSTSDLSEEEHTQDWEDEIDECKEGESINHRGHWESDCLD